MRYFNENQAYWGNTTQIIVGKDEYRLTARSVKIFADGALRTGGAAVRLKHLLFRRRAGSTSRGQQIAI